MVGEVQAVIRDLAGTGKTMMIVTHEMNFARSICNRVFYMDQGIILEDGTPEQVFSHPLNEQTRRFVRKLKVLELLIESREYDFAGAGTAIDLYCLRSNIPPRIKYRIHLVFEELVQQILLPVLDRTAIHAAMEYSEDQETATITFAYGGERFDPTAGENDLAKAYPQLAQQWHPTRNGALTPEQVTPYSNRPAWWVCEKGHEYRTVIANRTRLHAGCPYCSGRQVLPGFNDLATKEPLLCKQWDAEKNAPLTPQMVTVCSHKKVWWRCDEGHEWEAEIALRTRTRRDRCPICDRRKKKRK